MSFGNDASPPPPLCKTIAPSLNVPNNSAQVGLWLGLSHFPTFITLGCGSGKCITMFKSLGCLYEMLLLATSSFPLKSLALDGFWLDTTSVLGLCRSHSDGSFVETQHFCCYYLKCLIAAFLPMELKADYNINKIQKNPKTQTEATFLTWIGQAHPDSSHFGS